MKRQVIAGVMGVFVMMIAFIGTAQAHILDLSGIGENVMLSYNPVMNVDSSYDYKGFHFYGNGVLQGNAWISGWITVDPYFASYIGMHSSTPFTFNGAIFSHTNVAPNWDLSVQGWLHGSMIYSTWLSLELAPQYFNVNFVSIDELRFKTPMEVLVVGDFTYSPIGPVDPPTSVPEPSIFLVLAGGLVGIIYLRKRIAA